MGARSPLSGVIAAIAVLIIAWMLGPFLTHVPMPAVAAVLVLVGIGMIQFAEIRGFLKHRVDTVVLAVTFLTVAFIGLEAGILMAAVASIGFFVASASKLAFEVSTEGVVENIKVSGNLFYASLDPLAIHLRANPERHTRLDLSQVSYRDVAATTMIEWVRLERERSGGKLEVV